MRRWNFTLDGRKMFALKLRGTSATVTPPLPAVVDALREVREEDFPYRLSEELDPDQTVVRRFRERDGEHVARQLSISLLQREGLDFTWREIKR